MKKFALFSLLFVFLGCCWMTGCAKKSFNITLDAPETINVVLLEGDEELVAKENVFTVSSSAEVTVKVYSTSDDQDMSLLVITVNGEQKEAKDLVIYQGDDDLYCSFALPMAQIQKNVKLEFSFGVNAN